MRKELGIGLWVALVFMCGFSAQAKEVVLFNAADGLTITADKYTLHKDSSWIILCHRAQYSRGEYNETALRLNKLGFNCLAIDQRSGLIANGVRNETALRARENNLQNSYLDAEQDIVAAIDYIKRLHGKKVILLGSSYSASLVLKIAKENEQVTSVIAFSPGEYFQDKLRVSEAISGLSKPVFVTSAKIEIPKVKEITKGISLKWLTFFTPETEGAHGSAALDKATPGNQEYWIYLINFLRKSAVKA